MLLFFPEALRVPPSGLWALQFFCFQPCSCAHITILYWSSGPQLRKSSSLLFGWYGWWAEICYLTKQQEHPPKEFWGRIKNWDSDETLPWVIYDLLFHGQKLLGALTTLFALLIWQSLMSFDLYMLPLCI